MADLLVEGGGISASSNGNGIPSSRPPIPPPAQTSSPRGNIRGPRMIMQERQEREARRAERERMERAQAEQDARVLAEQRRQALERDRAAAAAAGAATANVPGPGTTSQAIDPAAQRRQQRAADRTTAGATGTGQSNIQQQPQLMQPPIMQQQAQQPQQRPVRLPQTTQAPPQLANPAEITPAQAPAVPPAGGAGAGVGVPPPPMGESGAAGGAGSRPRNSFPHAFERWEALSAHWEGLTSFWIRQLQQRSEEIDQDPLSRQLARQVTDLSAAGANLFHAVVELQRLRASSERKFQRWFFEMRADMERNNERQGMLEAALQEERRGRAEAIREAVENDQSSAKIQKQLVEMRKELTISKDEARRAWEELGRREQEERDRIISLQEGLPTIVGGVQVVPMTHGLPPRQRAASNPSREPQQPQMPQTAGSIPQAQQPRQGQPTEPAQQTQQAAQQSAVEHLPSQQYPQYTGPATGGTSSATTGGSGYLQQSTEETEGAGPASEPYGEEEEEQYGTPTSLPAPGTYPPSSSQHYYAPQPPDYSGQGYAAPGWETIPRHHHPTRLSDVIEEEDERSRTSASQISRG